MEEEKKMNQILRSDDRIFTEDIEVEILTWLPVKSLLRFMCVCKHWEASISSFSFRKLHRLRNNTPNPPLFLTCRAADSVYRRRYQCDDYLLTAVDLFGNAIEQWNLPLPISSASLKMLNCPFESKLVCFTNYSRSFFPYNPTTQQLFCIPNPPCFSLLNIVLHSSTLGYFPAKDEYVFVHLVMNEKWVCEVLTMSISDDFFLLDCGDWKSIEVTVMLSDVILGTCVFASGALYWDACDEDGNIFIISFEVEAETFTTIGLPQGMSPDYDIRVLELKDELYLLNIKDIPKTLEFWKLTSDVNKNKSWAHHWNFSLENLGFTEIPDPNEFDFEMFLYRVEYLQYHKQPSNALRELGRMKLGNDFLKYGDDYIIHNNLFTL